MPSESSAIHIPRPGDLKYVIKLHDDNWDSLGFLPRQAFEEYQQRGQIWVTRENDEPCGYMLFGGNRRDVPCGRRTDAGTMKIVHACIQYDARRIDHATQLVTMLEVRAVVQGFDRIALWCAQGLEANKFWAAMGYTNIGTRTKKRVHNRWFKALEGSRQRQLFAM